MTVERFVISFDKQLARRVRRAAQSQTSISAWLSDAAERKLRALGLQQIVRDLLAPFDPIAHQIGELCGRAKTRDLCDAHVAYVAALHGGVLYISDAPDLRRLFMHCGENSSTLVHC